jgi:hypothetical protein|eukprot:COSAG06_NODE_157_length_21766_cov_172.214335_17_plen_84_part_00
MQHDQRPYLQGAEWEALSDIGQALTRPYPLLLLSFVSDYDSINDHVDDEGGSSAAGGSGSSTVRSEEQGRREWRWPQTCGSIP